MKRVSFLLILLLPLVCSAAAKVGTLNPLEQAKQALAANRPSEAAKILSAYRPKADEVFVYHRTYAQSLEAAKRVYDSIGHLRLACLYAPDAALKEQANRERIEAYIRMGYYAEAVVASKVFLRTFPASALREKVHFDLALALYKQGLFQEAVANYEKAGGSTEAIGGRANALQELGRSKEAADLYATLLARGRQYISASPETQFFMGENYRMTGKSLDARLFLSQLKDTPMKHKAALSLGMLAFQEGRLKAATDFFKSALNSPDKGVKRSALLRLAEVSLKADERDDAKKRLQEIRLRYPFGKDYDSALLLLAGILRKEGKYDEATVQLRELIHRRSPDRRAIEEVEQILLAVREKDPERLAGIWKDVGHWLMEPTRSEKLLALAPGLRNAGKSYPKLCLWLIKHGPAQVKDHAGLMMAEFSADIGDIQGALNYLGGVKGKGVNEEILRTRARVYSLAKDYAKAVQALAALKALNQEDILLLTGILVAYRNDAKSVDLLEKAARRESVPPHVSLLAADLLYDQSRRSDALHHYRQALAGLEKTETAADEKVWALYRISLIAGDADSLDRLAKGPKGKAQLARLTEARLAEAKLAARTEKAF